MNEKFNLEFCSDLDYEELVADIYFEQRSIAMITQEKGVDAMEIEIFSTNKSIKSWKLPLDEFIEILIRAKNSLIKKQKMPE
jgi:hypothetical protein